MASSVTGFPRPVPATAPIVPNLGSLPAQQVGSTANITQLYPDPSSLTNLDALFDVGEQAVEMVRRMVPARVNREES